MKRKIELLAPAGSYESLIAAVHAGADAIYIGGTKFGARAYANNLDTEKLCEGIRYAHLQGCDLYLTVNTLLKDGEMEELKEYIRPYYEAGIDALIVQDMGVFAFLRNTFPDLPLHASTQMTILGSKGAAFLKEQGATRIVTARELSLEEIQNISKEVDIEIESFIHGALCYSYSGQCLFSSILGGRSGNRGRCAQPCRLPYKVLEDGKEITPKEDTYVLSPKDMCTIDLIPDLIEAGVTSFKIEGRMKRPEYTAGVVQIYRKYIDLYLEKGRKAYKVADVDKEILQLLYNRQGFSKGYYIQRNGSNMISLKHASHFSEKSKEAILKKQEYEALLASLKATYVDTTFKKKVSGYFYASTTTPMTLSVWDEHVNVTVEGEVAQIPKNQPMEEAAVLKQLKKTGNTNFLFEELNIELDGEIFLPLQQLNNLRRQALEEFAAAYHKNYERSFTELEDKPCKPKSFKGSHKNPTELCVQLSNLESYPVLLKKEEIRSFYFELNCLKNRLAKTLVEECHEAGKDCVFVLPTITRKDSYDKIAKLLKEFQNVKLDGILLKNLEQMELVLELGLDIPVILDHNMYTFNQEALQFWKEKNISLDTLPLELNDRELSRRGCETSQMIIYGYLPLMTTANCIHKTLNGCRKTSKLLYLKDRYQKEFPVWNDCEFCTNTIYNSTPLSILGSSKEVGNINPKSLRLIFSIESKEEVLEITDKYIQVFVYGKSGIAMGDFTKGHLKRGVE